jgi:hypothetical protein
MGVPAKYRKTTAAGTESAYGTESFPASADFYHQMDGERIEFDRENIPEPDYAGVADEIGSIEGNRTSSFTFPLTVRPSGTSGTAPDADEIIKTLLASRRDNVTDAVAASPTPSTTAYAISTEARVATKSFIVTTLTGVTKPEMRFCTLNSSATLTVTPPHTAAPTAGDAVTATNSYSFGSRAATAFLTIAEFLADGAGTQIKSLVAMGCVPNVMEWEWSKDSQFLTMRISGEGNGNVVNTGIGQLNEALDASETGVDVDDLSVFDIGSKIIVDTEAMAVTAKSADVGPGALTVERDYDGTTAATHSDNAVIYPYRPAVTLTTAVPVPSIYADVFIGVEGTQATATRIACRIELDVAYVRDSTTDDLVSRFVDGRRKVNFEVDMVMTDGQTQAINLTQGRWNGSQPLFIQLGNTAGKLVGFYAPLWYPEMSPLDLDGDGFYSVTLAGTCRGTTAGDDSLYIGLG